MGCSNSKEGSINEPTKMNAQERNQDSEVERPVKIDQSKKKGGGIKKGGVKTPMEKPKSQKSLQITENWKVDFSLEEVELSKPSNDSGASEKTRFGSVCFKNGTQSYCGIGYFGMVINENGVEKYTGNDVENLRKIIKNYQKCELIYRTK